jgi:hypothetical protein
MPANLLSGKHSHSIGVNFEAPTLEELKEEYLKKVLKLKPILARGTMDFLIEFDQETTIVKWKTDLLQELSISSLMMLKTLLENRMDSQQRTY